MCKIEEYNGNKLQFLDINILVDEWTEGRWARPIESLWENKLDSNCDVVVFPIQKYNIYKRKMTIKRICKYCDREFTPNSSKQTMCGFCFEINSCDMCGKVFLTQHKGIKKSDGYRNTFCSHECSRKFACSKMQEWYNEHPEKRSELCYNNHSNHSGIKYCKKCDKETYHLVGAGCIVCHNKTESKRESSRINMTNLWKNEEFRNLAFHFDYCEECQKITNHKFYTCLKCHPEVNGANGNSKIEEDFCEKCKTNTPHKNGECLVCKGSHIWCNHCKRYETIHFNSIQNHWIFYKSKTKQWMYENLNGSVRFLEDNIIGLKNLQDKIYTGIYCWKIDDIPYYIGQATNILNRSYDHMCNIDISPEYWINIKDNFDNHTLSIECLEECKREELDEKEKCWINKLLPLSQKCDGTDNIIPLEKRKFDIKNFKEIYFKRYK